MHLSLGESLLLAAAATVGIASAICARSLADGVLWGKSPSKTDDFSTAPLLDTLRTTLQQIDLLHNMFNLYPDTFGFVTESKDIMTTFRSGRIASLIGVEGLHQIANSASVLRMFHRLGVRYVTLAHDSNNLYVDSAVG